MLLADDGMCVNRMLALKKKSDVSLADATRVFAPSLPNRTDDDVAALQRDDPARHAELTAAATKLAARDDLAAFEERIGWKHAALCLYLAWERDRVGGDPERALDARHFAAAAADVFHLPRLAGDHRFGTIEVLPDQFLTVLCADRTRWSVDEAQNRHTLNAGTAGLVHADGSGTIAFHPVQLSSFEQVVDSLRRESGRIDAEAYDLVRDALVTRGTSAFDLSPPTLDLAQTSFLLSNDGAA